MVDSQGTALFLGKECAMARLIWGVPIQQPPLRPALFARPDLPMPLYSMFCMAKPAIGRSAVGSMMRLAGTTVLEKGGVLTDIVSFGQQDLAYDIRNQGVKYSQVRASAPPAIADPSPAAASAVRGHRDSDRS